MVCDIMSLVRAVLTNVNSDEARKRFGGGLVFWVFLLNLVAIFYIYRL